MRLNIYMTLLVASTILSLASCNHKDLCYSDCHKTKIRVVYDWSDAPEADPKGMCVFFYSETDGQYYRYDFDNKEGGSILLPAGEYRVITYNNDTELVRFTGTNVFDSHMAYTRQGDLLEPLYGNGITSGAKTLGGESVCIAPDALWGCHVARVTVSQNGVTYSCDRLDQTRCHKCDCNSAGEQIITLYPHDLLCHYSYEVRHVENAAYVSNVSAALSGMAAGMYLGDEALTDECVTIPVAGSVDLSSDKITGQFLTFGNTADNAIAHKMTFFVVMSDGSKYRIEGEPNLDVTGQVDNAPDRRHVHIIIDALKLPRPKGDENGWSPTVDDWGEVDEELHL